MKKKKKKKEKKKKKDQKRKEKMKRYLINIFVGIWGIPARGASILPWLKYSGN